MKNAYHSMQPTKHIEPPTNSDNLKDKYSPQLHSKNIEGLKKAKLTVFSWSQSFSGGIILYFFYGLVA